MEINYLILIPPPLLWSGRTAFGRFARWVSLLAECHTLPFGRVPYRQRQRRGRGKGDHFYSYLINNKNKKRAQGARDTFLHYLFSFVSFNLVSFFRQLD